MEGDTPVAQEIRAIPSPVHSSTKSFPSSNPSISPSRPAPPPPINPSTLFKEGSNSQSLLLEEPSLGSSPSHQTTSERKSSGHRKKSNTLPTSSTHQHPIHGSNNGDGSQANVQDMIPPTNNQNNQINNSNIRSTRSNTNRKNPKYDPRTSGEHPTRVGERVEAPGEKENATATSPRNSSGHPTRNPVFSLFKSLPLSFGSVRIRTASDPTKPKENEKV